jgi:hypothetical protein
VTPTEQVVIIGAARSGTRFLRRVLAGSDQVTAALFDLNHVWRAGSDEAPDDVLDPGTCTAERASAIARRLIAEAQGPRDATTLVEKTVSNSLRVDFVRTVFPRAHLVHLIRDGREAVLSAIGAWTEPSTLSYRLAKLRTFRPRDHRYLRRLVTRSGQATWGPRYPGIDDDLRVLPLHQVVARQWLACAIASADAFIERPATIEVRYEDLVDDSATVERLAAAVGLRDVDRVIAGWRAARRPQPPSWPGSLTAGARAEVLDVIEPGLRRLGYD